MYIMEVNRSEVNLSILSSLWLLLKSPITVYKAAYLCRGNLFSLFLGNNRLISGLYVGTAKEYEQATWNMKAIYWKFEMKAWWWLKKGNSKSHPDIIDPRSCWSNANTLKFQWLKIYSKPASLSQNIPCIPVFFFKYIYIFGRLSKSSFYALTLFPLSDCAAWCWQWRST